MNIGVIGLGIGKHHVEAFLNHPQCDKIFVTDFSPEQVERLKLRYPQLITLPDSNAIINNSEIDVVSIASYDNFHFEQIMLSLQKDKHVFVEKPFCMNSSELKEIQSLIRSKQGLVVSANHVLRTAPLFKELKSMISDEVFGDILHIEADYLWGRKDKLISGWRSKMSDYSIILGASVHMIDLILWLSGSFLPKKVTAFGSKIIDRNTKLNIDAFSLIVLEYEDGRICKVTGNGSCEHPHFHKLNLFGSKASFLHDVNGSVMADSHNLKEKDFSGLYPAKSLRNGIISNFIDVISKKKKTLIVDFEDISNVMSVCFSSINSMEKGSTELIKYH